MANVYPVYLAGLGWKHCVTSVSRVSQTQKHTTNLPYGTVPSKHSRPHLTPSAAPTNCTGHTVPYAHEFIPCTSHTGKYRQLSFSLSVRCNAHMRSEGLTEQTGLDKTSAIAYRIARVMSSYGLMLVHRNILTPMLTPNRTPQALARTRCSRNRLEGMFRGNSTLDATSLHCLRPPPLSLCWAPFSIRLNF